MKNVHAGFLALALAAFAIPALADPPDPPAPAPVPAASAPAPSASVQTVASATITGRAAKPQVLIEIQRQTPASAARDAHEQMRQAWLKKLQPSTTRSVR